MVQLFVPTMICFFFYFHNYSLWVGIQKPIIIDNWTLIHNINLWKLPWVIKYDIEKGMEWEGFDNTSLPQWNNTLFFQIGFYLYLTALNVKNILLLLLLLPIYIIFWICTNKYTLLLIIIITTNT